MDILENVFEQQIRENLTFPVIGAKLIRRKLEARGVVLDDADVKAIEEKLQDYSEDSSSLFLDFDDSKLEMLKGSDDETFTIDLSDDEANAHFDEIINSFYEKLGDAVPEIVKEITQPILQSLKRDATSMLKMRRKERKQFEKRYLKAWKIPLDLLEMFLALAYEAGEEFNSEFRQKASEEQDCVFDALTRMHARACQISSEILTLLSSGHADGAHARWRSLHEIAVVGSFIREHGNELAEKYLLHDAIESYKAALLYREYSETLGFEPMSDEEFNQIKEYRDHLVNRFGSSYKNNYGWAASTLQKDNPNFRDIEESVNLDHLRPFYKLASHNVHANPKGVFFKLGLYPNSEDILLAGPSNTGLTDPAQGTAISLTQITINLLTLEPNIDRLVQCNILLELEREIGEAFYSVQEAIENQAT